MTALITRAVRCLAVLALMFCFSNSASGGLIFFGEDLNPTGSGRIPLAGSNSEAARLAFLGLLVGAGNEDFESFVDDTPAPLVLSFPGSVGTITATLTGDGKIDTQTTGTSDAGRWPTSGDNYWTTNASPADFSVEFDTPVAAFGFYGTDVGDFDGQLTLTLTNGLTTELNIGNTIGAPNASLLFYGIIDIAHPFTKVAFGTSSGVDRFGFDDMVVAEASQVVPEPSTLVIWSLLGGIGLVVGGRRRLKANKQAA